MTNEQGMVKDTLFNILTSKELKGSMTTSMNKDKDTIRENVVVNQIEKSLKTGLSYTVEDLDEGCKVDVRVFRNSPTTKEEEITDLYRYHK